MSEKRSQTVGEKIKLARALEFCIEEGDLDSDLYYNYIVQRDPLIPLDKMVRNQYKLGDLHLQISENYERGTKMFVYHRKLAANAYSRAEKFISYMTEKEMVSICDLW